MNNYDENSKRRQRIRQAVHNRNGSVTSSRFDTSDIIQDTEIQIWQDRVKSGENEDDVVDLDPALLSTMARGHLAKNLRKHSADKRNAGLELPMSDTIGYSHDSPLERLMSTEQINRMLAEMNRMDLTERKILFSHFFRGAKLTEIEKELGLSKQQLRTRLQRAILHLENYMRQSGLI